MPLQVATRNDWFDVCRADIDYLTEQIRLMEPRLEEYQTIGLPMQIIHGDLHVSGMAESAH